MAVKVLALGEFKRPQFVLLDQFAWDNVFSPKSNQGTRMFLIPRNLNSVCRAETTGTVLPSEFDSHSWRLTIVELITRKTKRRLSSLGGAPGSQNAASKIN